YGVVLGAGQQYQSSMGQPDAHVTGCAGVQAVLVLAELGPHINKRDRAHTVSTAATDTQLHGTVGHGYEGMGAHNWRHDDNVNAYPSGLGAPVGDGHRLCSRYGMAFRRRQELERLSVEGDDHVPRLARRKAVAGLA